MGFSHTERSRAQQAMQLFDESQKILREADQKYQTHARIGLFNANSQGDDIIIYTPSGSYTLPFLRQQTPNKNGNCLCMSDFIRPRSKGQDKLGIFACSVDYELEETKQEDEYHHLLYQTLADRLAEATAECMHEMVRKEFWGYEPTEKLTIEELLEEKYIGKRPAVGYPSMPDQSINFLLGNLLDFKEIGISLTDTGAMRPHASTSGIMLSHPATRHFSIGHIEEDQLQDYAERRGIEPEKMRKFLISTQYNNV